MPTFLTSIRREKGREEEKEDEGTGGEREEKCGTRVMWRSALDKKQ